MFKNKGKKKRTSQIQDFTINDCANSSKPTSRGKKANAIHTISVVEQSWDEVNYDELEINGEVINEGIKKKRNRTKSEAHSIDNRPGIVYPEIVWYLISRFVKPEDIGRFARINHATYFITKQEVFWRRIYKKYCDNNPNLPDRLRLEYSYTLYGLRQRVVRSLYHTHDVFVNNIKEQAKHDSQPHQLVKRRCVNVWYSKGATYWSVYFKFKKMCPFQRIETMDFLDELGRIDANPEEDSQVLQVTCRNVYEVPPLMGMTLSSVSVVLSQGFRHHRVHLGFNTSPYNISRNILPEYSVILDTVVSIVVFDWWHPKYPYFDNKLPSNVSLETDETLPALKQDFFLR